MKSSQKNSIKNVKGVIPIRLIPIELNKCSEITLEKLTVAGDAHAHFNTHNAVRDNINQQGWSPY